MSHIRINLQSIHLISHFGGQRKLHVSVCESLCSKQSERLACFASKVGFMLISCDQERLEQICKEAHVDWNG